MRITPKQIFWLKVLIHSLNIGFLSLWYYWAFTDNLGADPAKAIIHFTGMGAFNVLLITLLVSPLAKRLKQPHLMKVRRLLGLYSFTWALLHFSNYLLFDLQLAFDTLFEDIIKRPYVTVGFTALIILLALAVTSTQKIQRVMKRNWQKLHNMIYIAAPLIALHFIWSVKSLDPEPLIYWGLVLMLLLTRRHKIKLFKTKKA